MWTLGVMSGGLLVSTMLWFPKGLGDPEAITAIVVYLVSALAIIYLGRQMYRAEALAEDRLRSGQAGFHLHLAKPVDPSSIESLLAALPPPRP